LDDGGQQPPRLFGLVALGDVLDDRDACAPTGKRKRSRGVFGDELRAVLAMIARGSRGLGVPPRRQPCPRALPSIVGEIRDLQLHELVEAVAVKKERRLVGGDRRECLDVKDEERQRACLKEEPVSLVGFAKGGCRRFGSISRRSFCGVGAGVSDGECRVVRKGLRDVLIAGVEGRRSRMKAK